MLQNLNFNIHYAPENPFFQLSWSLFGPFFHKSALFWYIYETFYARDHNCHHWGVCVTHPTHTLSSGSLFNHFICRFFSLTKTSSAHFWDHIWYKWWKHFEIRDWRKNLCGMAGLEAKLCGIWMGFGIEGKKCAGFSCAAVQCNQGKTKLLIHPGCHKSILWQS